MMFNPYLLLVTFSAPRLDQLDRGRIAVVNSFPYDGVALTVMGAYEAGDVPGMEQMDGVVRLVRRECRRHVWPWVFLNRIIGHRPGARAHRGARVNPYFRRIRGMDLENSAGALADFLEVWRLSLRLAREMEAPGIVFDPEAYNDYRVYDPVFLADVRGEDVGETLSLFRRLGGRLAEIAAEEYPGALVWALFTGLDGEPRYGCGGMLRTTAYLFEGFLEKAVRDGLRLKVVDGGETSVGYYNPSLEALRARVSSRALRAKPFLDRYGGKLVLAAPIAPYRDAYATSGWLRRAIGSSPPLKTLDDLIPLFRELLETYRLIWVYAASAASFFPFKPGADAYHEAITRLKQAFGK